MIISMVDSTTGLDGGVEIWILPTLANGPPVFVTELQFAIPAWRYICVWLDPQVGVRQFFKTFLFKVKGYTIHCIPGQLGRHIFY